MKLPAIVLPVFLSSNIAVAATKVDVVQLSVETYRLTLTSDVVIPVAVAQQELAPYAVDLCGADVPEFGKYQFEQNDAIGGGASPQEDAFVLVQEISCKAGARPATAGSSRTLGDAEKVAIEQSVQDLTEEYFRNIDALNLQASYAKLSPDMKASRSYVDWTAEMESFRSLSGPIREMNVWRITVYVDPPGVPQPGIYVAADLENSYENVPFQCGYLVWLEGTPGDFRIIREETGHVDSASIGGLRESDLQQIKQQFGCRPAGN